MVHVTPPLPAEVDRIATMLAEAFYDDPPVRALIRAEGQELRRRMFHLYRACLQAGPLQQGTVDVAREGSEILGAAIWHGPGTSNGILPYAPRIPDFLKAFGARDLVRAARIQTAAERYHPAGPHWYLQSIGVAPGLQGRGIGSMLLDHRLASIDAAGQSVYLESATPRTGILYARKGFVPLRRVDAWPEGAPYGMWRPAR